jgi:hypothetical protein
MTKKCPHNPPPLLLTRHKLRIRLLPHILPAALFYLYIKRICGQKLYHNNSWVKSVAQTLALFHPTVNPGIFIIWHCKPNVADGFGSTV